MRYNNISDVSFLRQLRGLTYLNLEFNKIQDITVLGVLNNLTFYNVGENPVKKPEDEFSQNRLYAVTEYYLSQKSHN